MTAYARRRWPVLLALVAALVAAGFVGQTFWVRALVFIAVLAVAAVILRFLVGWTWKRILWYWN